MHNSRCTARHAVGHVTGQPDRWKWFAAGEQGRYLHPRTHDSKAPGSRQMSLCMRWAKHAAGRGIRAMTAPNAQETRHQCMHRQAVPLNVGGGVRLVRGLRSCLQLYTVSLPNKEAQFRSRTESISVRNEMGHSRLELPYYCRKSFLKSSHYINNRQPITASLSQLRRCSRG